MSNGDLQATRKLILAGFLPLPWFMIWVTIGGMFMPGYSWISQHASEMTLVPGTADVLLKIGALGTGVFFVLFALGLWAYSGRKFAWGAICWAVFGFSMIANGVWSMGDPRHGFYAIGIFNIIAPALSLVENRKLADDRILYLTTIVVSLSGVLYLWLNVTGNDPEGYRGVTQRLFSSINSLWPMIVAWRVVASDRNQTRVDQRRRV